MSIFLQILKFDHSVRKTEELVRSLTNAPEKTGIVKPNGSLSEEYELLILRLSDYFKTNIQFARSVKGAGKITIPFRSDEELEKIMAILDKGNV